MRTHVVATRLLDDDRWPVVERFMRSPEQWLPPPAQLAPDGDDVVATARLGPFRHPIRLTVGPAWRLHDAVVRRIGWVPCDDHGEPLHTAALPAFTGRLTVRHAEQELSVTLTGWYEPPGGPLGAGLDRALMHRSGDATAAALVDDVAGRLRTPAIEESPR